MKNLFIKKLECKKPVSIEEVAHLLTTKTVTIPIDVLNWEKAFPYKPDLKFRIGHTGDEIWLTYYVKEKNILAKETRINGDVYKDSTVEFFISVDGKNYYNFEFNCIGTPHVAHGPGRGNRTFVKPETVQTIQIKSTLGNQPFDEKSGNFEWEMTIRIPITCFAFDSIKSLDGLKATANFYKCGDETSDPHFVSWNPIKTENPDYHCPQFFGKVEFE
ncbi:carbohydrate-binding family 9-like protein [Prolixibacteraceae bacterium Z1-6]|uniref:Carbohydrate-binding family 9-like protein n=1 Tax=Draconibacterium aestuarii TaxID=2998507 RepID=A0A9X3J4U0_9BACT|nr:carbohydrate-binding family 9-like protein [Prolixibacteraceae bacterium Z1-6]